MTTPILRDATAADFPQLAALLAETSLPLAGVADHLAAFLVAEDDGGLVGSAGLEIYGAHALLRSVAVATNRRGTGLGRILIEAAIGRARSRGLESVTLLTTTAADYFPRFGFRRIDQAAAPAAVRRSTQFNGICPATAVAMQLELNPRQAAS